MSKVEISGSGMRTTLTVDGRQINAASCALYIDSRAMTQLEIELPVLEASVGMEARVHLTGSTRDALIAMGWTPPEDSDGP